jgi:hypothetical protein
MARSACTAPEAEGVRQPRGARGGAQTAQVLVPVQYDRSNDGYLEDRQHVAQRMCTLFLPERASTQYLC